MTALRMWLYRRRLAKVKKLLRELDRAHAAYEGEHWLASAEYRDLRPRLINAFDKADRLLDR